MASIQQRLLNRTRLRRRRTLRAGDVALAVRHLDAVASARLLGAELANDLRRLTTEDPNAISDEQRVRIQVEVATKLHTGGQLSYAEYVFFAAHPVVNVAEQRWLDDAYRSELQPFDAQMEALAEASYDEDTDSWRADESAREYARLELETEAILQRKEEEVFHEFGLTDLADFRERDPQAFERTYERGRRALFHREAQVHALRDAVAGTQEEAELAGSAGAYSLGAAAYGAAIEGLLALRCMRSPKKARRLANAITGKKQPPDPLRWNFDVLVAVAERAGWLPQFNTEFIVHRTAGWADYLRKLRNLIHPPRLARERPWVRLGEREYQTARAIHAVVAAALQDRRGLAGRVPPA